MGSMVKVLQKLSSMTRPRGSESSGSPVVGVKRKISGAASASDPTTEVPFAKGSVFRSDALGRWYPPVMVGPRTLGNAAENPSYLRKAMRVMEMLEADDYVRYLMEYYSQGLDRFGDAWRYADIVTALTACADLIKPQSYLEIGVRRGRSMAVVAAACPESSIAGFDSWVPDYAGMANPGTDFVRKEMFKLGYGGSLELIRGNSHETIQQYFQQHPNAFFDLATVDGDHSEAGARQDLKEVKPRIKIGGVVVFDDIVHPKHLYLHRVWHEIIGSDPDFSTWEFTELGFGVALALRMR
jgi:predicted O-methyltransferase YrrM